MSLIIRYFIHASRQLRLSDQNNQLLREQLEKKDRDLVDERQRTQKLLDQLKNFHSHDQRNRSTREDELIEEIERLSYLVPLYGSSLVKWEEHWKYAVPTNHRWPTGLVVTHAAAHESDETRIVDYLYLLLVNKKSRSLMIKRIDMSRNSGRTWRRSSSYWNVR
jgi:hypothetical protein